MVVTIFNEHKNAMNHFLLTDCCCLLPLFINNSKMVNIENTLSYELIEWIVHREHDFSPFVVGFTHQP